MIEQKLNTSTEVHLDFIDRCKILFGRKIKVNTTLIILTEKEVENANGFSSVQIIKKSKSKFSTELKEFGYTPVD